MRFGTAFAALLLAGATVPGAARMLQDAGGRHSSTKTAGAVSIAAEPALSDGRLVLRVAAQNRGKQPIAFGPASVRIITAAGDAVALRPLEALIAEVRSAAGLGAGSGAAAAPAQESPLITTNNSGQKDVSGFTGSMGAGPVAQPARRRLRKPSEVHAAEAQIAALKEGILGDTVIAPGQLAAGQVVTEKIRFRNKRERGLVVTVSLRGEDHRFELTAPAG